MERISLVTLPYAGAGAGFFRSWDAHTSALDVVPVQLPGREEQFVEPPLRDVNKAVDAALPVLVQLIDTGSKVAVFGHSLGAVLAYELTQRLVAEDRVEVVRLIVSGSAAPWVRRDERATGLPDDEFLAQVRKFAGYDHPALDNPEMRELLLPTLRADVEMHEAYVSGPDRPLLPCPVTAVRARQDELVTAAAVSEWADTTTGGFRQLEPEGGHMYLCDDTVATVRLLEAELATAEPAAGI